MSAQDDLAAVLYARRPQYDSVNKPKTWTDANDWFKRRFREDADAIIASGFMDKRIQELEDEVRDLRYEIEDHVTEFEQWGTLCRRGPHIDLDEGCHGKGPGLYVAKADSDAKTQEWVDWLRKRSRGFMTIERDKLAALLAALDGREPARQIDRRKADKIIAAGWRPPMPPAANPHQPSVGSHPVNYYCRHCYQNWPCDGADD